MSNKAIRDKSSDEEEEGRVASHGPRKLADRARPSWDHDKQMWQCKHCRYATPDRSNSRRHFLCKHQKTFEFLCKCGAGFQRYKLLNVGYLFGSTNTL